MSIPIFVAGRIGRTLASDGAWLPTVSIDVSNYPAIADLARVHAVEGIGDVSTHVMRENDSIVMGVQITIPVVAMFAVVFDRSTHRDFLVDVAQVGALTFATTDIELAQFEQPLWLSVDIDGEALIQSID